MPVSRISKLLVFALPLAAVAACAGPRTGERDPQVQIEELRGQIANQADQLKAQQQRIEALELRLAAVAARPPPTPTADAPSDKNLPPVKIDNTNTPPKALQTVKLHPAKSGRLVRRPVRRNLAEQAPRLPATVQLKEPDDDRLAELDSSPPGNPQIRDQVAADQAFAQAVRQLNSGDYLTAQTEFLSFASHWPRNASADDAVYYAGLARAASGDCAGALTQFDRVMRDYPAGNARVPARLEKGRCLLALGRRTEGRAQLETLVDEERGGLEAQQAKALLDSDDVGTQKKK